MFLLFENLLVCPFRPSASEFKKTDRLFPCVTSPEVLSERLLCLPACCERHRYLDLVLGRSFSVFLVAVDVAEGYGTNPFVEHHFLEQFRSQAPLSCQYLHESAVF